MTGDSMLFLGDLDKVPIINSYQQNYQLSRYKQVLITLFITQLSTTYDDCVDNS